MKEPISVEAYRNASGDLQPRAFTWRMERYPIHTTGRQWEEGEERHFLVMTPGNKVFEIGYDRDEHRWYLYRHPGHFGPPSYSV